MGPSDRRTVLRRAAWSTPVIVVAGAAPAFAASSDRAVMSYRFATYTNFAAGSPGTAMLILGNSGTGIYPAGATFDFTVSQTNSQTITRTPTVSTTLTRGFTWEVLPGSPRYMVAYRLTLTAPIAAGTGTYPLSNPTFAVDLPRADWIHLTTSLVTYSSGTGAAQTSMRQGTWYDSSVAGWQQPSAGSTYPTGITRQTRAI